MMQKGVQRVTRKWMGLLLGGLCLFAGAALAQRVEGDRAAAQSAYEAEVPVRSQTDGEREKAFSRALAQALTNVTGDRAVAQRAGVRDELLKAKDYVDSYDYRQDEGVSATGAPSFQTTLVVRFKKDAVDDVVTMLGLPNWPQPRAKPVLWLGIDDGSGPRLVGLGQYNAARSILDQAKLRGFALGLPAGNAAEQAAVGAIWRGDVGAISTLSKRYSPPIQLIGKLQRGVTGWSADWMLVDNGKVLSNWQTTNPDARRAMAGGAEGAADAMFKRYAKAAGDGVPGIYRIHVNGIRGGDDYLRLVGYLENLGAVRRVVPVTAQAGSLDLDLELVAGVVNFARYVNRGGVMATSLDLTADTIPTQGVTFQMVGG